MPSKKPYHILAINNSVIVIGTDYQRLDDYDNSLFEELSILSYVGEIYFDFLLSNGLGKDRFYKAYFNGKSLDIDSMTNVSMESNPLLSISNTYLVNQSSILDNGVLSSNEISEFKSRFSKCKPEKELAFAHN
jgi:hypothetical protein